MLSRYSNSKFKVCDIGSYYLIETNCYSSEKVATVSYGGTVQFDGKSKHDKSLQKEILEFVDEWNSNSCLSVDKFKVSHPSRDGDNSNGSSGTLLYEDGEDEGYRPLGYSQYGPVWIDE